MFRVNDTIGTFGYEFATIEEALAVAVRRTARYGADHRILDRYGNETFGVEADTKVDDTDPYFPAIVHVRDPARTGAQC